MIMKGDYDMIQNTLFFLFERLKVTRSERVSIIVLSSILLLGSLVAATIDPRRIDDPGLFAERDSIFKVLSERRIQEESLIMDRYVLGEINNKTDPETSLLSASSAPTSSEKSSKSSIKKKLEPNSISLNGASASELARIPGIGPKTAEAIIQYRSENGPFQEISHIIKVKGIGPKKWEQIRPYLRL
jgi:comEA protein